MNDITTETEQKQSEDPLLPEDPLPVVDGLRECCANCALLKDCVQIGVERRVGKQMQLFQARAFPLLNERAREGKGVLRKVVKAAHFPPELSARAGEAQCIEPKNIVLIRHVIQSVLHEERHAAKIADQTAMIDS